jgi:two-component system sensor histidine kinase YesM
MAWKAAAADRRERAASRKTRSASELRTHQAECPPRNSCTTPLDSTVCWPRRTGTDEFIHIIRGAFGLLRISLSQGPGLIPLSYEIKHLQCYLTIQKIRYPGLLDTRSSIPGELY